VAKEGNCYSIGVVNVIMLKAGEEVSHLVQPSKSVPWWGMGHAHHYIDIVKG